MPRRMTDLPVAENVRRHLARIADRMGGGHVRVGFLEGATYPDGTPVAAVMYWNEFGHEGRFPAPPRSFFRRMISKEQSTWAPKMAKLAKATNYDGLTVLKLMGEDIAGALRQSIIETNEPALSPTTLILRAKFWTNPGAITISDVLAAQLEAANGAEGASGTQAKPLVWSGHALASVGYEVKRGAAV